MEKTITLTFGDQAENHVRMQKIGHLAKVGFSLKDLTRAKNLIDDSSCELICLNDFLPYNLRENSTAAYLLIVRNGVNSILSGSSTNDLLIEQEKLEPDKKAFMYGSV